MSFQNEIVTLVGGPVTADVAAGTPGVWLVGKAPGPASAKYIIDEAWFLPDSAMTFNATNFSTYTLKNETTGVVLLTRALSAVSSVANTPEQLTQVAGTLISGGDVLSWNKVESGTGLAGRPRISVRLKRIAG